MFSFRICKREGNLLGEIVHEPVGVLRGQQQLPLVGLGHAVTLKAILKTKHKLARKQQQQQQQQRTREIVGI